MDYFLRHVDTSFTTPATAISRMKLVAISLLLLLGAGCSPREAELTNQTPDPEIIAKLEALVVLEERALETQRLIYEMGKADGSALLAAQTDLVEARLQLAKEKGDAEGGTEQLEALVANTKEILTREEALAPEDRRTEDELATLRAAVFKAELRLLRHRKKH